VSQCCYAKNSHTHKETFVVEELHCPAQRGELNPTQTFWEDWNSNHKPGFIVRAWLWVLWTWLGLMQRPCWCPAHSSSLPPSAWRIMEVWIVVHAYYQLFIHSVLLIECVVTLMPPSGHMTSILPSILERDPPAAPEGFFTFVPVNFFVPSFWEFFLIRCEVKGQGCRMCTDCKALWGKFVIMGDTI